MGRVTEPAATMTARQVQQHLFRHFTPKWAVLFEVTARVEGSLGEALAAAGTDGAREVLAAHRDRRIDALLVRRAPKRAPAAPPRPVPVQVEGEGLFAAPPPRAARPADGGDNGGLERLAIEVKVSRADFFSDVRDPHKQAPWRELADRHTYAVPKGLVRLEEVPAGSGLIEVSPAGLVVWARRAPRVGAVRPLPLENLLDAFYRAARAEARARGLDHTGGDADRDEQSLRAELARLRHDLELRQGRLERAEGAAELWRRRFAALEPPPCATCGSPLRPARQRLIEYGELLEWEHERGQEEVCHPLRASTPERERQRREEYRHALWVPGPRPVYPGDVNESNTSCTVSA